MLASGSRKRPRSDGDVDRSPQQPAETGVPEQPDTLHVQLPSGWGVKRTRTKVSGGLLDPGTPTDADLAAASTAFQQRDGDSVANAEEDFPAFNDEEMEWLMELLP